MDDEKYGKMEALAKEFQEKTAPRLQKYLILKSWWTTNYVRTPRFPSAGGGSSTTCPPTTAWPSWGGMWHWSPPLQHQER